MDYKNSAMVFQALLDGLIHLRNETLQTADDFSAFSDIADEWHKCEATLSDLMLTCLVGMQNKDCE